MTHHRLAVEIFSSVILKGKPYVRRCFPIDHVLLDAAGWVEALDGVPKGPLLVRNGPGVDRVNMEGFVAFNCVYNAVRKLDKI